MEISIFSIIWNLMMKSHDWRVWVWEIEKWWSHFENISKPVNHGVRIGERRTLGHCLSGFVLLWSTRWREWNALTHWVFTFSNYLYIRCDLLVYKLLYNGIALWGAALCSLLLWSACVWVSCLCYDMYWINRTPSNLALIHCH